MFESYQGCWEESIPLICEENGQARVSGLLRFLGQDCDATSAGVTNVYAGIYGDVYNWITETINLNDTGESGDNPTSEFFPHQEAALARHNYHRCQHGVQSMTLSAALIDSAQAHADQLAATDNAHDMSWLPLELPQNVHIILSTLPKLHGAWIS